MSHHELQNEPEESTYSTWSDLSACVYKAKSLWWLHAPDLIHTLFKNSIEKIFKKNQGVNQLRKTTINLWPPHTCMCLHTMCLHT